MGITSLKNVFQLELYKLILVTIENNNKLYK